MHGSLHCVDQCMAVCTVQTSEHATAGVTGLIVMVGSRCEGCEPASFQCGVRGGLLVMIEVTTER